jgi:hypothetical protein
MIDILYVYVDDSDLEDCHAFVGAAFFALSQRWASKACRFVDDRHPRTPELHADDFPQWNLGIEMPRNKFGRNEVSELVAFASDLSARSGRTFVLGVGREEGWSEDLAFLGAAAGEREIAWLTEHVAEPKPFIQADAFGAA